VHPPDVYRRDVDFLVTRSGWPGEIDRIRVIVGRRAEALERRRADRPEEGPATDRKKPGYET
jgi:hypothetical protein